MEDTLTEQRKCRPTIHHPFDEFELVHLSFDQTVVLRQSEASQHSRFVSLNASDDAGEFIYLTGLRFF
jgi:hypothetical protein